MAPEDTLEVVALNHAIHAAWNLKRYRRLEADLMANGLDPILDNSAAKVLDRLHRYAARAERSYYRAMEELRKLQTYRGLWDATQDVDRCPAMADVAAVAKRTHEVDAFLNIPRADRIEETYEQIFVPLRR